MMFALNPWFINPFSPEVKRTKCFLCSQWVVVQPYGMSEYYLFHSFRDGEECPMSDPFSSLGKDETEALLGYEDDVLP